MPQDRRPDLKPNPPATLLLPAILEQHIELLTLYRRYEPLSCIGHCYTADAKHALKYIEENVIDFDFHLTFSPDISITLFYLQHPYKNEAWLSFGGLGDRQVHTKYSQQPNVSRPRSYLSSHAQLSTKHFKQEEP